MITYSARDEHTAPLFNKLKALQLSKIHVYKVGLIMFKVWHGDIPGVFSSLFTRNVTIHTY